MLHSLQVDEVKISQSTAPLVKGALLSFSHSVVSGLKVRDEEFVWVNRPHIKTMFVRGFHQDLCVGLYLKQHKIKQNISVNKTQKGIPASLQS